MPLPTPSTDHVLRALGRLIQQYQKPDIEKWLGSFIEEIQELEEAVWSVIKGVYLDNAEGVNLDMIGEIVREKRLGRVDGTYRLGIRTRIRINRSHGRSIDVLEVARMIVGDAYPQLIMVDQQPATIIANFAQGVDFGTYSTLVTSMLETKAAGVKMWLLFGAEPNPNCPFDGGSSFIFSHDDAAGLYIKNGQPPAMYFHTDDIADDNPHPVVIPRRYGVGQITAVGAPTRTEEWAGGKTIRLDGATQYLEVGDLAPFHTNQAQPWFVVIALVKDVATTSPETVFSLSRLGDVDNNIKLNFVSATQLRLESTDSVGAFTSVSMTRPAVGTGTPVILGVAVGSGQVTVAELSSKGMNTLGRQPWNAAGVLVGINQFNFGDLVTDGAPPSQKLNGAIRAAVVTQGFALDYVSELTDLMYQLRDNNCSVSGAPLLVAPSAGIVAEDSEKAFGGTWSEGLGVCVAELGVTDILFGNELETWFFGQDTTAAEVTRDFRFRLGELKFNVSGRNPGRALLLFLVFQEPVKITNMKLLSAASDTISAPGTLMGFGITSGQLSVDILCAVIQTGNIHVDPVLSFGSAEFQELFCAASNQTHDVRFFKARVGVGQVDTLGCVCSGASGVKMYVWEGEYETAFQFSAPYGCAAFEDDSVGTTPDFDVNEAVDTGKLAHIQSAGDLPPSTSFDPSNYAAVWLSSSSTLVDTSNKVSRLFNLGNEGSQWDAILEAPGDEPLLVPSGTPSGRPSLRFEVSEHLLTDAAESFDTAFMNPITIISLVKRTGTASVDAYSNKVSKDIRSLVLVGNAFLMFGAGVSEFIDTNAPGAGVWQLHVAVHSGSKSRASQNGAPYTTPKILNNPITDLELVNGDLSSLPKLVNWRIGGTALLSGSSVELAEFAVVRGDLGPQQVCDMVEFFKTRHGIE